MNVFSRRARSALFCTLALLSFLPLSPLASAEASDLAAFERLCASGAPQELAEILKTFSGDVTFPSGNRPLHVAAEHATGPEIIELLIRNGASLSALGLERRTPLMLAAAYNPNESATNALIDSGASMDASDAGGRTPLHLAAAMNPSPKPLAALLRHGASPNALDQAGQTPLWIAASLGAPDKVRLLLDAGAKVDAFSASGQTPLFAATDRPNAEVFRLLIDAGADANARAPSRLTPLMNAVMRGAGVEALQVLIDGHADVQAEDDQNRGALFLAASRSAEGVEFLVSVGARLEGRDTSLLTPLMEACRANKPDVVRSLLKSGANPKLRDRNALTPLHHATRSGASAPLLRLLVEAGAQVDETDRQGSTPLMLSIANKTRPDTSLALLELSADPNRKNMETLTPLMIAISEGNDAVADALLSADANPSLATWDGLTPLMIAARRTGDPGVFKRLAAAGALVDQVSDQGMTALMVAAASDNAPAVKTLLDLGADPQRRDFDDATPLLQSLQSQTESLEILELLISADSNLETPDFRGATPLMIAALTGKTATVRRLLEAGARADAQDVTGWTPLHFAARGERGLDALKLLLPLLPEADRPDFGGTTPLMVAAAYNNPKGVSVLLDAGANPRTPDNTGRNAADYARLKNAPDCLTLLEAASTSEKVKREGASETRARRNLSRPHPLSPELKCVIVPR